VKIWQKQYHGESGVYGEGDNYVFHPKDPDYKLT
jgi:hypothetical protein